MSNDLIAQNQQMRALALALFPRCRKNLGAFNATGVGSNGGGSARIKLYNVGLGTRLLVEVVANVTIGSHATAVAGPKSPFNMVDKFRLTDYDGTDRINCSGFALTQANRKRRAVQGMGIGLGFRNNASFGVLSAAAGSNVVDQPQLIEPAMPIAIATDNWRCWYEIPMAYEPESDLRGAVLMQTALGEMYLNIDFNSTFQAAAANVDAVAVVDTASTVVVNSITINVWQEYLLLQAVGGQAPLPQLDLLTVYELNEVRSTDNIAVSQEKLINFPNVRSVVGLMLNYVNNGAMSSGVGSINRFRQIVNGNNVLTDDNDRSQLVQQRQILRGLDFGNSCYLWDYSRKPIETAIFGNVQMGVTPTAFTAGNTHIDYTFESLYTKGSVLPGMSQSA